MKKSCYNCIFSSLITNKELLKNILYFGCSKTKHKLFEDYNFYCNHYKGVKYYLDPKRSKPLLKELGYHVIIKYENITIPYNSKVLSITISKPNFFLKEYYIGDILIYSNNNLKDRMDKLRYILTHGVLLNSNGKEFNYKLESTFIKSGIYKFRNNTIIVTN